MPYSSDLSEINTTNRKKIKLAEFHLPGNYLPGSFFWFSSIALGKCLQDVLFIDYILKALLKYPFPLVRSTFFYVIQPTHDDSDEPECETERINYTFFF